MLYLKDIIPNYEGFKSVFGDKNTRNNKVALAYFVATAKELIGNVKHGCVPTLISANSEVYTAMLNEMHDKGTGCYIHLLKIKLPYCSRRLDERGGFTEDGDTQVRYILNGNTDRPMKMKIGKFLRAVITESDVFKHLPESCINYFVEKASNEWESKHPVNNSYELVVDNDFEKLYTSEYHAGDFGSCMTNDDQYSFYEDAVEARAASLWKDGEMYARCVIFDKVNELETGAVYRLAERQYAVDKNPVLKQILINKLIEAGEIDGYKHPDACFSDANKFFKNDGTSMVDSKLYISCNLDFGDIKSYQDSFKWYDYDERTAYNYEFSYGCYDLSNCDRYFESDEEEVTVYRWDSRQGRYYEDYQCQSEAEDNCVLIGDDYYADWETDIHGDHIRCDEARYSDYQNDYIHEDEAVYSEWKESYLYSNDAKWIDEMEDYVPYDEWEECFEYWKAENWEFDEVNEEYVKDTIEVYVYNPQIRKWVRKDTNAECEDDYTDIDGDLYKTNQLTEYYYEVA